MMMKLPRLEDEGLGDGGHRGDHHGRQVRMIVKIKLNLKSTSIIELIIN